MKRNPDFNYLMSEEIDDKPDNIEDRIRNSKHHKYGKGRFSPHTDITGKYCTWNCKDYEWRGSILEISGMKSEIVCKRYQTAMERDPNKYYLFASNTRRCIDCIREFGENPITRRPK